MAAHALRPNPGPTAVKRTASQPIAEPVPKAELSQATRERDRRRRAATAARHAEAERLAAEQLAERAREPRPNPLFDLPEKERAQLFMWLRNCPYDDAVVAMLEEKGLEGVSREELSDFFQHEAEGHWEKRIERAALEANALVQLVEKNPVHFSSGILAALGQEAFRQIASGEADPNAMTKMATLFLKARGDERAEQMLEMRREKWMRDWRSQTEKALDALAGELSENPGAREVFNQLKAQLLDSQEEIIA